MPNCCESGAPAPESYEAAGAIVRIGVTTVYFSKRRETISSYRGILLLLPDGFGLAKHNFILADSFAKEGWDAIVPDYFEGDGLPIQLLKRNPKLTIDEQPWSDEDKQKLRHLDFPAWNQRHNHTHVSNMLTALLSDLDLQYPDIPKFGVGYCFGGKHVFRLGRQGLKAVAAFHPSFVEADDLKDTRAPIYVGLAGADTMVPASLRDDLLKWKAEGIKDSVPFELEVFPQMPHGFAARPESEDPSTRTQYGKAFQKAVEHLVRHASTS